MEYKFKVGDKVRVSECYDDLGDKSGVGVIAQVDEHDTCMPYLVFLNDGNQWWCSEYKLKLIPPTPKEMLKPGMVVEHANGRLTMVFENRNNELLFITDDGSYCRLIHYNDDLDDLVDVTTNQWDINKIYGLASRFCDLNEISITDRSLLWERSKQPEEMTLEQVCEELGREIKIVKG